MDLESDDVIASEHDADDWSATLGLAWQEWDRVYPSRGRLVVKNTPAETA
jgi:hypothetical protein